MTRGARLLVCASALLLGTLIVLRVFAPTYVVGQAMGAVLAVAWGFAGASAFTWQKNVGIYPSSPWSALLVITALFVGGVTDFALGISVLSPSKVDAPLPIVLFLVLVSLVCGIGWWRLLRGGREVVRRQSKAPNAMLIAFGLCCVLVLIVGYFR